MVGVGSYIYNLRQRCLSTHTMAVCTLYSVNSLVMRASSFSGVAGPRQGGRSMTAMNGALMSGGMGSGVRERRSQSMSVAQEIRAVL